MSASPNGSILVIIVSGGIIAGCFAALAFMMLDAFVRGGV